MDNKLVEKLIEWFLREKRWPLLFLLPGIPCAFIFIQKFFELSFRETFFHWSFLISSGGLFILSGVFYFAILPQSMPSHRRWFGIPIAVIGFIVLFLGLLLLRPPSLPEDKLVVTIVRFTPISPGADQEANNFPHRVEQKLREKQHEGVPLEIKRLSIEVSGVNEEERRDSAMTIGTSMKGSAHIVLWGEVRKDEGELYVKPRLTVTGRLGKAYIKETELRGLTFYEPKHIEFKERLANEITDIVMFLYGSAYYKEGNWNRAVEILDHVNSSCGYLYKGLSLHNRAHQFLNPQLDLRTAIETYEKILGAISWNLTTRADTLNWEAYLNRANAVARLGLYSKPKESLAYLREAVEAYRTILQIRTQTEFPQNWADIQNDLGVTLKNLGIRVGPEEGIKLIQKAVEAHQSALQVYSQAEFPQQWAMTQDNLGVALDELGKRIGGEEGIKLIQKAVEAHQAALHVYTQAEFPQDWAHIQLNFGATLSSLSGRGGP